MFDFGLIGIIIRNFSIRVFYVYLVKKNSFFLFTILCEYKYISFFTINPKVQKFFYWLLATDEKISSLAPIVVKNDPKQQINIH
jgi:hypothetical protein